ncbi:large ribosomal subunit protein bL17m [Centruroides vittatus]|uniref:large ribosomal subunit protein bL17m n=1 Tax=Centruroides vittatus TaxID=120091 RepID=UPI003510B29F
MSEFVPPAVKKLIPLIKCRVRYEKRKFSNPEGPYGRLLKLRDVVTAVVKHERIELNLNKADEARGYIERLITEAIRNGDKHVPTMELATFWLEEEQLIHKLFKVLVPRYNSYNECYTLLHMVPRQFENTVTGKDKTSLYITERAVLELKGNPFPPMPGRIAPNNRFLTNILLNEAKKEFLAQKFQKQQEQEMQNLK